MTAAKFWDDLFLSNYNYSQIGGIASDELCMIEYEFLFVLDFNLYVDNSTYIVYYEKLEKFLKNIKMS